MQRQELQVELSLHQGLALNSFLLAVKDVLTAEFRDRHGSHAPFVGGLAIEAATGEEEQA